MVSRADVAEAVDRARDRSALEISSYLRSAPGWGESSQIKFISSPGRGEGSDRTAVFFNPKYKLTIHLYLRTWRGEWELIIREPTCTDYLAKGFGLDPLKVALEEHAKV